MAETDTDIPKGSYAAGNRVELPADAMPPFGVFINGVEQLEGKDYEFRAGGIVFSRQIIKEKIGTSRWLAMYLGLWGTYRKNETVDLQFVRDGKTELESDLAVLSE
ncbi:MAG: hypothetical protein AB7V58_00255 [Solirubrobacterales bacterium]